MSIAGRPEASGGEDQLLAYARELGGAYTLLQAQNEALPAPLSGAEPPQRRTCQGAVLVASYPSLPAFYEKAGSQPGPVVDRLNLHLELAVREVQAHGGLVEHFGDAGLTASFGARTEVAAPELAAVAAAVALVGANARFNEHHDAALWLDVSAGIAAGWLYVGLVGAAHRWEMAVAGDCVNVARHLASKALPLEILLSDEIYTAVEESMRARPAGQTWVHGREARVQPWSVKPLA